MSTAQEVALQRLSERVGHSLSMRDQNDDCIFVEVEGVTVTIGVKGAYGVPSVRSYVEGLETAANARLLWNKQEDRDRNSPRAEEYERGTLTLSSIKLGDV